MLSNSVRSTAPFLFIVLLASGCVERESHGGSLDGLVPVPLSIEPLDAGFVCDGHLTVAWPKGWLAEQGVVQRWWDEAGIVLQAVEDNSADLKFLWDDAVMGKEAYRLVVDSGKMEISASGPAGLFRRPLCLCVLLACVLVCSCALLAHLSRR